jgi:prepilin-type processing-associated H-X9-DG protein
MMQLKRKLNPCLLLIFCLPGVALHAYEMDQTLGSHIDDQTFALVHLDLTRLDLDALAHQTFNLMREHGGADATKHTQAEFSRFLAQADAQLNGLLKAGAKDVFVVSSLYDFPYFSVLMPVPPGKNQGALRKEVQRLSEDFKLGDVVVQASEDLIQVGLEKTLSRPRVASPAQFRVLTAALQACGDSMAQLVLCPSSDQRRVLAEMLPQVPLESAAMQWTALSQDMEWMALGVNAPPSLSANLTLQSSSAEGAGRQLALIKTLYAFIGKQLQAQTDEPKLDQILRRLSPEKRGRSLRLQINTQAADSLIRDVLTVLTPSLRQARKQARRKVCMNNLRQVGLALRMYADEHDDQLPPDLEFSTIGKYLGSVHRVLVCPATQGDSYVYRGATITVAAIPSMIMAYDRKGNHEGGRNVVFLDGHAEWVTEERLNKLIEKDNEYRRGKKLPVLPMQ